MKKKYFKILILLLVIALGSFYLFKTNTKAASAPSTVALRIFENNNPGNNAIHAVTNTMPTPPAISLPFSINPANGITIQWAGEDPSTLDYRSCVASSTNSGSTAWSWTGGDNNAILNPLNWSTPVIDHPTITTKYSVSCVSFFSNVYFLAEIEVTPGTGTGTGGSGSGTGTVGGTGGSGTGGTLGTGTGTGTTRNKIYGWAWSSTVGWISLNNCTDPAITETCTGINYGLDYDIVSGNITGFAWSNLVGWIQFGHLFGFPNSTISNNNTSDAKIDLNTGVITGWARVLSLVNPNDTESGSEWADGWISLYSNSVSARYGVAFNMITGNPIPRSFAWGDKVTGWIGFDAARIIALPQEEVNSSVVLKAIDGTTANNISTSTASNMGVNPNSDSLTLSTGSNNVNLYWGAENVNYATCVAISSPVSSWSWNNPSNHATLTMLGGPINDILTTPTVYTVSCKSSDILGTIISASIKVTPVDPIIIETCPDGQTGTPPNCVDAGGNNPPPGDLTFYPDSSTVYPSLDNNGDPILNSGQLTYKAKLNWISVNQNLVACQASSMPITPSWSGLVSSPTGVPQHFPVDVPASPTTYYLSCKDNVTGLPFTFTPFNVVRNIPAESTTFTYTIPVPITPGLASSDYSTTLSWTTTNVKTNSCSASSSVATNWTGGISNNNNQSSGHQAGVVVPVVPPPPATTAYNFDCIGLYTHATIHKVLNLNKNSQPPILKHPSFIER
ncbi:MAG: hypothetical protein NTZ44_00885 [Candidatus Nomurabacteria bacterium]|nr:hypothetical protein [Candidatus Nomurabacteria bacterium]